MAAELVISVRLVMSVGDYVGTCDDRLMLGQSVTRVYQQLCKSGQGIGPATWIRTHSLRAFSSEGK